MIENSPKLSARLLAVAVLSLSAACNVSAGGQIPCADDSSCPADYPVCSAGKCVAGISTSAVSVAIVGVQGHAPGDILAGTATVAVTARANTGVQSVTLTGGTKTYQKNASSAPPLYYFDVITSEVSNTAGDATLTATVTAGNGTTATSPPLTIHIDNNVPTLTIALVGSANAAVGSVVKFDVTTSEAVRAVTGTVSGTGSGSLSEISVASGLVHHFGYAVSSADAIGAHDVTFNTVNLAGTSGTSTATAAFAVFGPAAIASFSASPGSVVTGSGSLVSLSYVFAGGNCGAANSNCVITNDQDATVINIPSNPSVTASTPVSVGKTTTYMLSVTNAGGTTTRQTVTVRATPVISSFQAGQSTVTSGQGTTLSFSFAGAACTGKDPCTISDDHSGTPFTLTSGSTAVIVTPSSPSTIYTLLVTDSFGASVTASVTIAVVASPAITAFSASPSSFVTGASTSVTLTAAFTGGNCGPLNSNCTITEQTGGTTVKIFSTNNGGLSQTASPSAITATTVYTLRVTNAAGAVKTQSVTVSAAPQINSFSGPSTVTATTSSTVVPVTFLLSGTNCVPASNCQITGANVTTSAVTSDAATGANVTINTSALPVTVTMNFIVTDTAGVTASATLVVTAAASPAITTFSASPSSFVTGASTSVTLTAAFIGGNCGPLNSNCIITEQTGGTTVKTFSTNNGGSSQTASPSAITATTVYTLRVTNAAGTVKTQSVTVSAAPRINSFSGPSTVTATTSSTVVPVTFLLSGTNCAASNCQITGANVTTSAVISDAATGANVTINTSALPVTVTMNFTVTDTAGVTASATLVVTAVAPANIQSFVANTPSIPLGGTTTFTATFCTSPTVTCTTSIVDNTGTIAIGNVTSGSPTGTVSPTNTTTYTLIVKNGGVGTNGTVTATVTVTVTSVWASGPVLTVGTARKGHTATLLPTLEVLITGGRDASGTTLSSAEIYNPSSNTFRSLTGGTTTLAFGRFQHTATLLSNGRVLITGGSAATANVAVDVFDPSTDSFLSTPGSLNFARVQHTATLLNNGKVLIAGGVICNNLGCLSPGPLVGSGDAELLTVDPNTGFVTVRTNLTMAGTAGRSLHTATLIRSGTNIGKVLLAGGCAPCTNMTAEIFDPAGPSFTATGAGRDLVQVRFGHTATLLDDGATVFIMGGSATAPAPPANPTSGTQTAEIFSAGSFTATNPAPNQARVLHTATLLSNGNVLLAGGTGATSGSAEVFSNTGPTYTTVGDMKAVRSLHTATFLFGGNLLVVGGQNAAGNAVNTTEVFSP